MKIEVLGSGCPTCKKLFEMTKEFARNEDIEATVEYSDDIARIAELGLMKSPVLVINGAPTDFRFNPEGIKEAILGNGQKKDCNGRSCGGGCC